ncbi:hypothetical protein WJX84_012209 [Apatococcus fuscideae]|uniref:Phosphate transporter n=1 Tax=Apatococcus fuscideae TaxID=2026836 RepID=A0AAW1TDR9_9CHLO
MVFAQYTWVMGLSVAAAFASAFGIGANDVANSFATSVASRALTLFQAVCVAGVFEFLGAILLGASVTDTIKNSIAKTSAFSTAPALLLYGMFCALCTSAIWDNLACHLGLAVSTSHTIIGSIIERLFSYAQVCSACVMSFAHGANDVANAMGPFAAIYAIWQSSAIPSKSNVPEWILVVGGAGIVCGLALYGHKIMRVLGCEMVQLTCARGFAVELSTAIVVMVASYSGLPVSTTQTVTGAIIAVGCFEGIRGVNWKIAGKIFLGWILTILVTALFCAGLTSLAVYAPNKPGVYDTVYIAGRLDGLVGSIVREVNGTNRGLPTPNATLTRVIGTLNSTLTTYGKSRVKLPRKEMDLFSQAFTLYNQSTGITL